VLITQVCIALKFVPHSILQS